jgi:hypothetical protein
MKKVKIKGLVENDVNIILTFMSSKLTDEIYICMIELGGNDCNMDWMEDDMDISGDDMIHELFDIYGDYEEGGDYYFYTLKIDDYIFKTSKCGENWSEEYEVER